jgi:O-antigen ligase
MDAGLVLKVWRETRQEFAAAGIRMVEENPAFGLGPGTAYRELGRGHYYGPDDKYVIDRHENLHNYFLQVAAETGLLGLAGFLWAVLAVVARAYSRDLGEERPLARLFAIGVTGYLITAFTSHPLILSKQAFLFLWGAWASWRRAHSSDKNEAVNFERSWTLPPSKSYPGRADCGKERR